MSRTQFTFYESFFVALSRVKKKQDRADAYDMICNYALYGKLPDMEKLPDSVAIAFELLRPVLDKAGKRAECGKKGGSKPEANGKQNGSKPEANAKLEREGEVEIEGEREREGDREGERVRDREGYEQTDSKTILSKLWSAYPVSRRGSFEAVLLDVSKMDITTDDLSTALSNLPLWVKSIGWTQENGRYIPGLAKWLASGKWESPPPANQLTSNPFLAMAMEGGCYDQK